MARPGRPEQSRTAGSSTGLGDSIAASHSDELFGTHNSRADNRVLSRVIRVPGSWILLGHLSWAVIRSSRDKNYYCCTRQGVPVFERAFLEAAKSFVRAPVHATVPPAQSISPYFEAQASPALSNAVPSSHSYFRSQVVLPIRDPIYSFGSESL
jgi:hypothetical protein